MLTIAHGDIFAVPADALVNPVNCVGVMGAGLALQFKQRYPEMFDNYASVCRTKWLRPGRLHVYPVADRRFVINFPTKRHYRDSSRIEDIYDGLAALESIALHYALKRISIPALGCGLGGLRLADVQPLIEYRASRMPQVTITLVLPLPDSSL